VVSIPHIIIADSNTHIPSDLYPLVIKLHGKSAAIEYLSPMENIVLEKEVERRSKIKYEKQKDGIYICTHQPQHTSE